MAGVVIQLEAPSLGWLVLGSMLCALALASFACFEIARTSLDRRELRMLREAHARWLPVTFGGETLWRAPPREVR